MAGSKIIEALESYSTQYGFKRNCDLIPLVPELPANPEFAPANPVSVDLREHESEIF